MSNLIASNAKLLCNAQAIRYPGRIKDKGYLLGPRNLATGEGRHASDIPSRFPGIGADFTLTHAVETPWAEIDRTIAENAPEDLVAWKLKVRYRGQGVPEGAVNTTISFHYNAGDRSLTQEEVNARQLGLNQELERRFGWRE